jgi:hypothetical protein
MIASHRYSNIVVVVPTIALIDETRRRLMERFRGEFKIITHVGQERAARNIFVLTQERVVDTPELEGVDFFVIDEFYKLNPTRDVERAALLNQAFYRLFRQGAQFYLLGPNIRHIPLDLPNRIGFRFIATDFATVVSEITRVASTRLNRFDRLVDLWSGLDEPTLVYCAAPASARRVVAELEASRRRESSPELEEAAEWIATHYHEDWILVRALRRGIGLHHGKVPRAIQQFFVRAFNEGKLHTLVCTSTLIEGVNTKAKNVIVFDNKVATRKFDFFTFNNIKGRSGRMFQHFVGHVYLFNDPPAEELPLVDIPVFTQPEDAPESLLIQLDERDLTPRSRERLSDIERQQVLPLNIIRENRGIDPRAQIALAQALLSRPREYARGMAWSGMPSYDELKLVCELVWEHLLNGQPRSGVASAAQLTYRINAFRTIKSPRRMIVDQMMKAREPDADDAVEDVLDFVRTWATFQFPRYLMAVDRIQRAVFQPLNLPCGDYAVFAASLENYFQPPGIAALDEYGVPLQLAQRLSSRLGKPASLDEALIALRELDIASVELTAFERDLLIDAKRFV